MKEQLNEGERGKCKYDGNGETLKAGHVHICDST